MKRSLKGKATVSLAPSFREDLQSIHNSLSVWLGEKPDLSVSLGPKQPVDIRTFITHPDYCGDTGFWEKPLQELERILAPGCKGAVIEKGIRGSKTYPTSYIPLYYTYRLAFEEFVLGQDPRLRYDLSPETVIYNAIFTVTGKLAKELFRYMSRFARRCRWFQQYLSVNPRITSQLEFMDIQTGEVRYVAYPGTSVLTSAAGTALFSYILDECNLFTVADSSGQDYAESIDEELDQRVTAGFGEDGARIYISRRNIVSDFTTRKKAEWESLPDGHSRYYIPPPKTSWDDWPDQRNAREQWQLFDATRLDWVKGEDGKSLAPSLYQETRDKDGLWVPQRFWDNFTSNPESALKVLASIPAEANEPFIRRRDKIRPDFELRNPIKKTTKPEDWMREGVVFDDLVEDWFYGDPECRYHFHCDLALNKNNRGDSCGSGHRGDFPTRLFSES